MNDMKKVDLHLHLDGSLSCSLVKKLCEEIQIDYQGKTAEQLMMVSGNCSSLSEYLDCFDLPTRVLQTEQALTLSAYDLVKRLDADGVVYAEIRFAPQLHKRGGLSQQQAVEAVLKGVELAVAEQVAVKIGILLCMMVDGSYIDNRETAELCKAYWKKGVIGMDLAGPEGAVPLERFGELFKIADREGVPFTIHAGECGDYENVVKAISFGARRIGHGCGAVFSRECIELLRRERIVVETCPVSNLQTKAVKSIEEHPIRRFFDMGVLVTVNTDNLTVSNTSLEREYSILKEKLGFTDNELEYMNEIAFQAGFLFV